MESPYSLKEVPRRPRDRKKLAAQITRRAVRQASRFALLPPLPTIPDVELLTPSSPTYNKYLPAYNLRTTVRPALRALCKTEQSVAAMLDWVRRYGLPFALRSGGHSYEGFSHSANVVIDVRKIAGMTLDAAGQTVTVGSGASLGAVYKALKGSGFAFAAGSCPTVGVAGHALGGGFGLLGRAYGLTCDNLLSVDIVDANCSIFIADASRHPDLFWACRGGGGGSFGIATTFRFRVQPLSRVVVFGVTWTVPKATAVRLFNAWQQWAPATTSAITSIMKVGSRSDGKLSLRCIGQSTGSEGALRRELDALLTLQRPTVPLSIRTLTFFGAVDHFSGGWDYETTYSKAKSDYVVNGLSDDGIERPVGGSATDSGGSCGRAVRRIWRSSRRGAGRRHSLSTPGPAHILYPILFQLDECGRYSATSHNHVEGVCRDAPLRPGDGLRKLLRLGPAELGGHLLGRQP